jgi:PilZ domain
MNLSILMKKDKPVVNTFIARKSKRVPLKIRFKVNGRDTYGNEFEDFIETQDVGGNGASFGIKYEIRVGSTLKLTGPKGFVALVRVVWVKQDPRSPHCIIGFQLLEPREDWVLQSQNRTSPIFTPKRKS